MFLKGRKNTTNCRTTSLYSTDNKAPSAVSSRTTRSVVLIASLSVCAGLYQFKFSDLGFSHTVTTSSTSNTMGLIETAQTITPAATDTQVAKVNTVNSYIVRAQDFEQLKSELERLEVKPTHELQIIKSVAVELTKAQVLDLEQRLDVKITLNHSVETAGTNPPPGQVQFQPDAVIASFINVDQQHYNGNFGDGLTIGYLDTGLDHFQSYHCNVVDRR